MKIVRGALIINLLIGAFMLNGCGEKTIEKKEIKVGVALYNGEDVFIKAVGEEIEKRALEVIDEEKEIISVDILDGKEDMEIQSAQVENFIEEEYDVICINIVDRTMSASIIDKCREENIPVIFFNREIVEEDIKRWDKVYYVGSDGKEAGKLQGEIVKEKYKNDKKSVDKNGDGKIQYAILEGEVGHQDTVLRSEYCIKSLRSDGIYAEKIDSKYGNWKRENAKEIMDKWLEEYGEKIEVIFSNNDEMALGASEVINRNNKDKGRNYNPIIIGVDGTLEGINGVNNNDIAGTVISDYKRQGQEIFDLAYKLNKEETYIESNIIKIPHKKISNPSRKN